MDFELVGELSNIETIAINLSIGELENLRRRHGGKRWRKLKGMSMVRLPNGKLRRAEIHWYECHGIGRRKIKIKRFLDE